VPFYVALPLSTIDRTIQNGISEIPIEQRDADEIRFIEGYANNTIQKVRIMPEDSPVANYGFDVTPAKYVTALVTENGVCQAEKNNIDQLFKT
jgi:methylthioribose-1-phosphate isomerase